MRFLAYCSLLFLAVIGGAGVLALMPIMIFYGYLGLTLITLLVYALDKYKAITGRWRIQESTLHILALLGGWPGAALAQQWLWHKSAKLAFKKIYWLTLVANLIALAGLISYSDALVTIIEQLPRSLAHR